MKSLYKKDITYQKRKDNAEEAVAIQKESIKQFFKEWEKLPPMRKEKPLVYWRKLANTGTCNPWVLLFARWLFSIPGSTAALERAFSHADYVVQRAGCFRQRAAETIFMHENTIRGVFPED